MNGPHAMRVKSSLFALAAILALVLGCSTDSPTAPVQEPAPPPGTSPPSAAWNITVDVSPRELTVGAEQPTTVSIRVRRADTGQSPPSGTTIVVSASLGDLLSLASGINSVAVSVVGGRAQVLLFAGPVAGTSLINVQLENSVGRVTLPIREPLDPVVAAFSFQNSEENLSIVFLNESTGDPTSYLWDFGDGTTSTEEHPHHLFPYAGDFVVSLTARKPGVPSSTFSDFVTAGQPNELFISFITPDSGPAAGGTVVTIEGNGFRQLLRVLFGNKLGDVLSVGSTAVSVVTPAGDLVTEACDDNDDGISGLRTSSVSVAVTVEIEGGASGSVPGGFTYLSPTGETCVGD